MSPIPGRPAPPAADPARGPAGARGRRTAAGKPMPRPRQGERPVYTGPPRKITLTEGVTVKELGEKMEDVKSRDIIKALISRGIMATVNQTLDPALAIEICKEFGYEASIQSFEEEVEQEQATDSKPEDLVPARARGHRHGPRRPRQDVAPRRHPRDHRGRGRGGRHHPAHRRLPRGRGHAEGRLPRHPRPRGVHPHARPRGQGHRRRGAGGRGGRRRDAPDGRGHGPRARPRGCPSWWP